MDASKRINKLYARVRVLHDETLYMLFILSFNKKLTPEIQQMITEISHDLEGMYGKKKL